MGKPITTTQGVCVAFPDVCNTPSPTGQIPVPYPNIGQLSDARATATKTVLVGGEPIITSNSQIPTTTGDEAGSGGGTTNGQIKGKVEFVTFSQTVKAEGGNIVRQLDTTKQNEGNAVGIVLGGVPNVLVGD